MLVTIVTPSFNQARFLEDTIQSVLGQKGVAIEYFIIDGGSTDGSVEIIRRYENRLSGWISEPDRGQTDAINKGFQLAHGDIYAWLNSDDTYAPDSIARAAKFLESHPDVGVVYGDANYIDADGRMIGRFPAAQTNYAKLRQGYVHIPQQAAFFRADLWKAVGPLDPSFYFAMDYDLWVRLSRVSKLEYYPQVWANFRLHGDAKTLTADDRCWPEMLRVHRRDGGSWFSVIYAKFWMRKMAAPYINWKRKRLMTRR